MTDARAALAERIVWHICVAVDGASEAWCENVVVARLKQATQNLRIDSAGSRHTARPVQGGV